MVGGVGGDFSHTWTDDWTAGAVIRRTAVVPSRGVMKIMED